MKYILFPILAVSIILLAKKEGMLIYMENVMSSETSYNKLTPAEAKVILNKGTEKPFTGKYNDFFEEGVYVCKRCDAPLYPSDDKFKTTCGWPGFDDDIPGAVKRKSDADGRRTEILCSRCGAHLGHVFKGERLTQKNTRHCVNSISMRFVSAAKFAERKTAYFAGGCFWGVEYFFDQRPSVYSADSGYMGGSVENPTYKEVCGKMTGHYETVKIVYDPEKVSYEELVKYFFEIHDSTHPDGQGPDKGPQYPSAIFYLNEKEKVICEKLIGILKKKGLHVATKLIAGGSFWKAEEYHQNHYLRKGGLPYCHAYVKRF